MGRLVRLLLALGLSASLAGCALPAPQERADRAQRLAQASGWTPLRLPASGFELQAWLSPVAGGAPADGTLTVYIEGDGLVAVSRNLPALDPTPLDPLSLRLALADGGPLVAYLARPCQYLAGRPAGPCRTTHWTDRRFAPELIQAVGEALDSLKRASGASTLRLIGHSGGAAMAALVAAGRRDVVAWASVAGNLDTDAWQRLHALSPLTGSMNPRDVATPLRALPQRHLVGMRDPVVPVTVLESFLAAMDGHPAVVGSDARVLLKPDFDHVCCWARDWPRLRARIP